MGRCFERFHWGRPSVACILRRGRAGRVVGRRLQSPCRSVLELGGRRSTRGVRLFPVLAGYGAGMWLDRVDICRRRRSGRALRVVA